MELLPRVPDEDETQMMVAQAQAGDDAILEDLFTRLHDHILLAVRLRLGTGLRSVMESRDIFQSVALEAIRDLPKFEARGHGSFRHYLNRMVLNNIRDRANHFNAVKRQGCEAAPQSVLENVPDASSEVTYHDSSGRFERLERQIANLPEEMRQVLVLRAVDGLPSKQVAELLGKSDAAIRKIYSRAVAQLATSAADGEDE